MRKIGTSLVLIFMALLLLGGYREQKDYPLVIEEVEGIRSVTSPNYPREGRFEYALIEGDENAIFNRPFDMKIGSDGSIYVLDWGDTNIKVCDNQGKPEFVLGLEFSPLPNPRYQGGSWQMKNLPAFRRGAVLDGEGNIWIEVWRKEDAEGILYDLFSPEGVFLKQIRVDHRIKLFRGGKAYGFVRDEEGYFSVKRFRLELREEGEQP